MHLYFPRNDNRLGKARQGKARRGSDRESRSRHLVLLFLPDNDSLHGSRHLRNSFPPSLLFSFCACAGSLSKYIYILHPSPPWRPRRSRSSSAKPRRPRRRPRAMSRCAAAAAIPPVRTRRVRQRGKAVSAPRQRADWRRRASRGIVFHTLDGARGRKIVFCWSHVFFYLFWSCFCMYPKHSLSVTHQAVAVSAHDHVQRRQAMPYEEKTGCEPECEFGPGKQSSER